MKMEMTSILIWLADTHPDALPDYANLRTLFHNMVWIPFKPFKEDEQVGDKQSDIESIDTSCRNGGKVLDESDMETENSGTPCPDN